MNQLLTGVALFLIGLFFMWFLPWFYRRNNDPLEASIKRIAARQRKLTREEANAEFEKSLNAPNTRIVGQHIRPLTEEEKSIYSSIYDPKPILPDFSKDIKPTGKYPMEPAPFVSMTEDEFFKILKEARQDYKDSPPEPETKGSRMARENRAICNKLTDEEHEYYAKKGMERLNEYRQSKDGK